MDLAALKTAARFRLDDPVDGDELWTDGELTEYTNEAINEACLRARLNLDSTSVDCSVVDVIAGQASYEIHPSVFLIERAYLETTQRVISKVGFEDLDAQSAVWPTDEDTPVSYLTDLNNFAEFGAASQQLQLYPIPLISEILRLTVYRLPLEDLASDGDEPDLPVQHRPFLLDWICHRAYQKQDADTLDASKALHFEQAFELHFGMRIDARRQEWRRKQRSKRVVGSWL